MVLFVQKQNSVRIIFTIFSMLFSSLQSLLLSLVYHHCHPRSWHGPCQRRDHVNYFPLAPGHFQCIGIPKKIEKVFPGWFFSDVVSIISRFPTVPSSLGLATSCSHGLGWEDAIPMMAMLGEKTLVTAFFLHPLITGTALPDFQVDLSR